jgi:hypothetical protein
MHLNKSWVIPPHGTIENQNKPTKIAGLTYYMFYSEKSSFDEILDWLKSDVIEMNIEVEQKEELLKQKVAQLKEVFENSSLDELKNLKFSSEEDMLKLNSSSKNNTEKEEKSNKKDEKTVEA